MIKFHLIEEKKVIELSSIGTYNIYFVGGYKVKIEEGFGISMRNIEKGNYINITQNSFKIRAWIECQKAVNFYTFEIRELGKYEIEFSNITKLSMNKSMLIISSLLFPSPVALSDIEVAIMKN